jgi:YHS domain-containing protein
MGAQQLPVNHNHHEGGFTMKLFLSLAVLAVLAVTPTMSAAESGKPQTKCPIKGGDIDKDVFVDVAGKRVFFCCPGCGDKFLKDAAGNLKTMKNHGVKVAAAVCPVSGEEAEAELSYEHAGNTHYFCCKKCLGKFKKSPAKYSDKHAAHGHAGHDHDTHKGHDHGKHDHGGHKGHDHGDHKHKK